MIEFRNYLLHKDGMKLIKFENISKRNKNNFNK